MLTAGSAHAQIGPMQKQQKWLKCNEKTLWLISEWLITSQQLCIQLEGDDLDKQKNERLQVDVAVGLELQQMFTLISNT